MLDFMLQFLRFLVSFVSKVRFSVQPLKGGLASHRENLKLLPFVRLPFSLQ
jgi:hypothetical protein